jgi:hypothetical protein
MEIRHRLSAVKDIDKEIIYRRKYKNEVNCFISASKTSLIPLSYN